MTTEIAFPPFIVRQEDERNWVLYRTTGRTSQKGKSAGEPIVEHLGYYDSLQAALKSGIRHGMKGLGPITPPAIVAHIDAIYAQIEEAVRKQ